MTSANDSCDALVIGAGPAGSAAAIGLARRGWRVTLVDRAERGRAKCCGHCIHPHGVARLVELLGTDAVASLVNAHGSTTRRGLVLRVDGNGESRVAEQAFAGEGVAIDRRALDAALLDRAAGAGVDVRLRVAARLVGNDDHGADVTLDGVTARVRLVVGADGLGSGVARAAGLVGERVGRKFGFALDVPRRGGDDASEPADAIRMYVADGGYLGVVRTADRWHLAACVASNADMPSRPFDAIDWFAARAPTLRALLGHGWRERAFGFAAVGPMPWSTRARTAPSVALVGDAAGYVEPFTGEGITWALASSAAFVEATAERGAWGVEERRRYERLWRERLRAGHRRTALVASVLERRSLVGAIGAFGRAFPELQRRVAATLMPR